MPCGLALIRRRRQAGRPGDLAQALPPAHHRCAACGLCRMSLAGHLQGLRARFDLLALRPPAGRVSAAGDTLARQQPAWAGLQAWCRQGAGPGHSAWSQPGAQPQVAQRLAVAALRGPDETTTQVWAEAVARPARRQRSAGRLARRRHGHGRPGAAPLHQRPGRNVVAPAPTRRPLGRRLGDRHTPRPRPLAIGLPAAPRHAGAGRSAPGRIPAPAPGCTGSPQR